MKRIEFDQVTTRSGDDGRSSSYSGERLSKDDLLFETLGDLDELISYLGVVREQLRLVNAAPPADGRAGRRTDSDQAGGGRGRAAGGGQAGAHSLFRDAEKTLDGIQRNLMTVCAVFATSPSSQQFAEIPKIGEKDIEKLEKAEHALFRSTEISQQFVVPGDSASSVASVDVARSIARRCERRIVRTIRETQRPDWEARLCQNYVNRLSDYLFVLARSCEQHA